MRTLNSADLKAYRAICAEITNREKRLEDSKIHTEAVVQGSTQFPYNKRAIHVEGDLYPSGSDSERHKITLLKIRKREIEEAVENIDDYCARYAITRKFLDNSYGERVTWETVADELGNTTGEAIRTRVSRYLRQRK